MARVKTFVNGGSLLPGDLNQMQDDYEFAFSTYRGFKGATYRFDAVGAATYILAGGSGTGIPASNAAAGLSIFHYDPAWHTANTRSNLLRMHIVCATNATASAVNFTTGMYPVSAVAGGASALSITLGSVVTGSTVAFNAPAASTYAQTASSDFNAPGAGGYVIATVVSGSAAANSSVLITANLQYRQA